MSHEPALQSLAILPFSWKHWCDLWELRHYQLAEDGIIVPQSEIPDQPLDVGRDDPEWDYHYIAEVYLAGAGGFWLAWWEGVPVGHVGGQDLDGVVELRHMYVREVYRRHGIGTQLVQALQEHCKHQAVNAVELWTGNDGPGRRLYARLGFAVIDRPVGSRLDDLIQRTNGVPGDSEVRMRYEIS